MPSSAQPRTTSDLVRKAVHHQGGNIVVVKVGPYHLALPAAEVLAIVEPLALHTLPWVGGGVLGVANFRDQVALVVSVRQKLGLEDLPAAEVGQFILTRISTGLTAFWVDQTLDLIDRQACATGGIEIIGKFTPFWRCLLHQRQILFDIDFETLFALTPPKGIRLFQTDHRNEVENKQPSDAEPSIESGAAVGRGKTMPPGMVSDPASAQMGQETEGAGATLVKAKQPTAPCRVKSSPRVHMPASAVDPVFRVVRPSRSLRREKQVSAPIKLRVIRGPAPARFRPAAAPIKIKSMRWSWIGLAAALFIALAVGWWVRPAPSKPASSRAPVLAAARAQVQTKNPVSTISTSHKALPGEGSAPLATVHPVSEPRPAVAPPPIHMENASAGQEAENQATALEAPATIPDRAVAIAGEKPAQPAAPHPGLRVEPRTPESGPRMPVGQKPLRTLEIQSDTFTFTIERQVEPQNKPIPFSPAGQKPFGEIIHVVVKGDTLWHIAIRYLGDPWRYPELAALSRIRNPDRIYPGDVIRIVKRSRSRIDK